MEYKNHGVEICFCQSVVYEVGGEERILSLSGKDSRNPDIQVICLTERNNDELLIKMKVSNIGESEIFLRHLNYVNIPTWKDFIIGDGRSDQYRVYCQGRHKNDIPSVFSLGCQDECYQDAIGGMLENGEHGSVSDPQFVNSDSMTVFHHQGYSVLFGFLTGRNSFVHCRIGAGVGQEKTAAVVCGCESVNIFLEPGKTFSGEELLLKSGTQENELIRDYAVTKGKRYQMRRNAKAPAVFCTWYYYGLTVSYEDVYTNLMEIKRRELPYDVFQVDEGWEVTLGEWRPNERFPKTMKEVADEIKECGMKAGIWTSPFIAHASASIWNLHPEWRLIDKKGTPYEFPMNDTTYGVFDITNPAVYQYFTELYRRLTFDWGYAYHKLDFTRAAVIYEDADFYDKTVSLPQAYYRAVSAIREGMGEDAYFLMCGGLYDAVIGVVDAQRMGADMLSMWESHINRDGKALPFTVKQNLLRYYMNQWWNNDPDALMVREQPCMLRNLRLTLGLLNDEEVKTAVANQYMGGGLVCSTEPLSVIAEKRLYQLKHILPITEVKVEVRNLFSDGRFPSLADVEIVKGGFHNVVKINWDDKKEIPAEFTIGEAVLGEFAGSDKRYLAVEFYSGIYKKDLKKGDVFSAGVIKPHGTAMFKIEEYDPEKPYIIFSNAHYSMGAEVDRLEVKDGHLRMELFHYFQTESVYRILLPEGTVTKDCESIVEIRVAGTGKKAVSIPVRKGSQVLVPEFADIHCDIRDFGAVADGVTSNTEAINQAIRYVHDAGGGVVTIPGGIYLSGPVELLSNVCLHMESGSVLSFDKNREEYAPVITDFEGKKRVRARSMIYAEDAENIAITGRGVVDGNGDLWRPVKQFKVTERQWNRLLEQTDYVVDNGDEGGIWMPTKTIYEGHLAGEVSADEPDALERAGEFYDYYRPVLLSFRRCNKVLLEGVSFRNSPAWNLHPWFCTDVTIRGIEVYNPFHAQNGDALDVDSCRRVHISDSTFRAGDDGICLKSGKNQEARKTFGPTEDVYIHDCVVYEGFGGVVFGSEMSRGIRRVEVEKCTFIATDIGVNIKSAMGRGGAVEDIHIHDIVMKDIKKSALQLSMKYVHNLLNIHEEEQAFSEEDIPVFRRIDFERIVCAGADCDITIETPEGMERQIYDITLRESVIQHCRLRNMNKLEKILNLSSKIKTV